MTKLIYCEKGKSPTSVAMSDQYCFVRVPQAGKGTEPIKIFQKFPNKSPVFILWRPVLTVFEAIRLAEKKYARGRR